MIDEREIQVEMTQILDESGNGNAADREAFGEDLLLSMYRWMLKARQLDLRMMKMQRQGRIGTYAPYRGQEAAQVGSALALEKEDWMFPSYREVAAMIVHGSPLTQAILRSKGHFGGGGTEGAPNIFPVQIIIGAQTLHAVGCAWASKLKGENTVTVSYFGDGATSQGDFHEALNFAAVNQVPAVFFCQNNQWAISVPFRKQTASRSIAQKALAYGIKGVQVDGNDCLAVYQVTKEAAERARKGEGPTLIEAVTHRQGPHTTADDPTRYRTQQEIDVWNEKDPLIRFRRFLEARGLWSEQQETEEHRSIASEIDRAVKEAESSKPATLEDTFDSVYDRPTGRLKKQQEEVRSRTKERI